MSNECPHYVSEEECERRRRLRDQKDERQDTKLTEIMMAVQKNQTHIETIQRFLWGVLGVLATIIGAAVIKLFGG